MNLDTERLCNVLREIVADFQALEPPNCSPVTLFPLQPRERLQHKALDTAIALIGTLAETVASVEALVKDFGGADSGNAASGSAIPTGAEEDKREPTARPKPPAAPLSVDRKCCTCKHEEEPEEKPVVYNPCLECFVTENKETTLTKWEPKPPAPTPTEQDCGTCKHKELDSDLYPCRPCRGFDKWEPKLKDNRVREVGRVSETEQHAVRAGWMEG